MKAFVSYRHTGGSDDEIRSMLSAVRDALHELGVEPYCTYFDVPLEHDKPRPAPDTFMAEAFRMIEDSDFLFVIQESEHRSEGMLMEVGYCLAKGIPVVLATRAGVKHTYLPSMADLAFSWNDFDDLAKVIRGMELDGLNTRTAPR